jgi:hypothetical protein
MNLPPCWRGPRIGQVSRRVTTVGSHILILQDYLFSVKTVRELKSHFVVYFVLLLVVPVVIVCRVGRRAVLGVVDKGENVALQACLRWIFSIRTGSHFDVAPVMSIEIASDSDNVSFRIYFFAFPLNGISQNVAKVIIVMRSRLTANTVRVLEVEAVIAVLFGNVSWSGSTVDTILVGPPVKRTRSVHVSMASDCWNPE